MNQNEQNFEDLKRLLKFKRHEAPPPGYFNNFSGQVISRIRAGEAGGSQTFIERLQRDAPWLASKNLLSVSEPSAAAGSPVASMGEPALLPASDSSGIVASTNPVTSLQPTATLFGQAAASPLFQPAGFMPAGSR